MAIKANLDLPDASPPQFVEVRPASDAMLRQIGHSRPDAEAPAHTVRPGSLSGRGQPR
jgi:hypothetical protein